MFSNIEEGVLEVPENISKDALNLILNLLNRDPKERLGAGLRDAKEIKDHPFFRSINWNDAIKMKLVPLKPCITPITEMGISFDEYKNTKNDEDKMNKWTFISSAFK